MKGGITCFPGERIVPSFPKNKLIYEKIKKNQLSIISILIMALKTNILFTHFLAH